MHAPVLEVLDKMFNLIESSISGRSEGPGKGDVISIKCLFFFSSNSAETRDIHRCFLPQELRNERVLQRLGLAQRSRVYHSH